jgi:hypothetical protein
MNSVADASKVEIKDDIPMVDGLAETSFMVLRPRGWFLVHMLVDVVDHKGKETLMMCVHDLPRDAVRCDCGCYSGRRVHYVVLDPDTRRVALDAIDRARERLRTDPRRRGPSRRPRP